jgi:hypothetical protein
MGDSDRYAQSGNQRSAAQRDQLAAQALDDSKGANEACPKEVIEHALAHKIKDEAEAAYQRGTLLVKRAMLMDQWAMFCKDTHPTLISSGNSAGQTA